MDDWRAEAERAIGLALASSIQNAYSWARNQFYTFRRQSSLRESWPISVSHLIQCFASLKRKVLSVYSIRGKLATLAFARKAAGLTELTDDFQLQKMLEGWSREAGC